MKGVMYVVCGCIMCVLLTATQPVIDMLLANFFLIFCECF